MKAGSCESPFIDSEEEDIQEVAVSLAAKEVSVFSHLEKNKELDRRLFSVEKIFWLLVLTGFGES